MNLSEHFTLEELTASQMAARLDIDNTPPDEIITTLRDTAEGMEQVRKLLGLPITVSSGYRCTLLNRAVHGAANSQHTTGQAVDFICPAFGTPERILWAILKSDIAFDQCILEFDSWVHISFSHAPRMQALVIDHDGTRIYTA